jgi:hypothetical protein
VRVRKGLTKINLDRLIAISVIGDIAKLLELKYKPFVLKGTYAICRIVLKARNFVASHKLYLKMS